MKRSQYTHPPNGSFSGIPSHKSRVRLAPDEEMPRSETPWVVGLATRLEERRKSENPGTSRNRSSSSTPGVDSILSLPTTVIDAGASVEIVSVTVMLCLSGAILVSLLCSDGGCCGAGWFCAASHGGMVKTQQAHIRLSQIPAGIREFFGRDAEDNLKYILVMYSG